MVITSRSYGNRTYTAHWIKNYTTTFDGNGGTSYTITLDSGETSTYYPISQQASKVFTGWYTGQNSGTFVSQFSFDYYQDRTLYAHWGATITDTMQSKVTVHYLEKGTNNEIASDLVMRGDLGTEYATTPIIKIDDYELAKDDGGNYIIPANASGTYQDGDIEVTYYYEKLQNQVIVHHLLCNT